MKYIVDRIKVQQRKLGLTQHQLADKIGWDRSKVQRILNNRQDPSIEEFCDQLVKHISTDFNFHKISQEQNNSIKNLPEEIELNLNNDQGVETTIHIDIEGIVSLKIKGRMLTDAI